MNFLLSLLLFCLPAAQAKGDSFANELEGARLALLSSLPEDNTFRWTGPGEAAGCRNDRGQAGQNRVDLQELRWSKRGDCADLTGKDLQGVDLSGAQLRGASLSNANLTGADLSGANLEDAYFIQTRLARANLRKARIAGANFMYAVLAGADLSWAHARHTSFYLADLRQTVMRGADLEYSSFQTARANGADMRGANLAYARMWDARLQDASLQGANLQSARLGEGVDGRGGRLPAPQLVGADLTGAFFDAATELPFSAEEAFKRRMTGPNPPSAPRAAGAQLYSYGDDYFCQTASGARGYNEADRSGFKTTKSALCQDWTGANLYSRYDMAASDFRGTLLAGSLLSSTNLYGSDFRGADLRGAAMIMTRLENCNLRGARLTQADLTLANLNLSDLSSANLAAANLNSAKLIGAKLDGAILSWAKLDNAELRSAHYDKDTILPFDDEEAIRRGMVRDDRDWVQPPKLRGSNITW
jgi:uncharacterized protein YjbI with pentapeptide repeats